jgi:hypothetical protein
MRANNTAKLPQCPVKTTGGLSQIVAVFDHSRSMTVYSMLLECKSGELQGKLQAIGQARPRFECSGQKWVGLYSNGAYRFHPLQLSISNRPDVRVPGSLAANVSGRLAFFLRTVVCQFG